MVNYNEISYKAFGRCIKIDNGTIELIITLDIGPRIIRFSKIGGENVFFEDETLSINHNDKAALYKETFGDDKEAWANIGGHRLWAAPEALPRTYYPSCKSDYEKIANGVKITTPMQSFTHLRAEFEITIVGENEVKVQNRLQNCGAWPAKFAVWCISVAASGGTEIIPQSMQKTGLLHNRLIALWDYTDTEDKRVKWGNRYIRLRQDENADSAFKLGINSRDGFVLYFNHGDLFVKKFDVCENGSYPDGGMNFESYTNEHFLEIESLGELKEVACGEVSEHTEYWKIYSDVSLPESDELLDDIVSKYV